MKLSIRQITENMLKQFHERLISYKLREGMKTKDDFDVSKVVRPGSISRWEGKTAKEIFEAAKYIQDPTALEYIFWKMKGAITGAFWKNFLGPSGQIRKYRINNESAWEQWLGIAWMAMVGGFKEGGAQEKINKAASKKAGEDVFYDGQKGALDETNIDKIKEDDLWNVFATNYKHRLVQAAIHANQSQNNGGIRGGADSVFQYEPTWVEKGTDENDDDLGTSGSGYSDPSFDEVNTNIATEEFLKKWQQFVQDPALSTGSKDKRTAGVTPAMIFYEALTNPQAELRAMGELFGVSRNSCSTLLNRAQEIMLSYKISGQDLMNAIKILGNDKVGSYLKAATMTENKPVEEIVKKEPTIDDQTPAPKEPDVVVSSVVSKKQKEPASADFISKFEKAIVDDNMWTPHVKNCDAANYLFYWIESGFKDDATIASKYEMKEKDVGYWNRRAMKVLKTYNITEDELKKAVKQYGKKTITDLIGEDNDE